jgi:hypothetical protein
VLVGGIIAVCGAVILAADKGALGLVVSAFDTLSDHEFAQLKPGLRVMQKLAGWLVLLRLLVLLPLGFALLSIAMFSAGVLSVWQAITLIVGTMLLLAPDGFEIVSLFASVLIAIVLMPLGLQLLLWKKRCLQHATYTSLNIETDEPWTKNDVKSFFPCAQGRLLVFNEIS